MVVKAVPAVYLIVEVTEMTINSAYIEHENRIIAALGKMDYEEAEKVIESARRDPAINTDEFYCLAVSN